MLLQGRDFHFRRLVISIFKTTEIIINANKSKFGIYFRDTLPLHLSLKTTTSKYDMAEILRTLVKKKYLRIT